ncbi:protein crossbronx homolog isoform X2 [Hylaeus volcanicus]|uniref:protein crossbronx homolog isoform X2 n=1 Tax=Hylaeus volcanicus TaxID=313075 RepID=UPI0023B8197D|nr:protein crossbronx homolog isoform X2 [Hylaeus volcanicus]
MEEINNNHKVTLLRDKPKKNKHKSVKLNENINYYNQAVSSAYRLLDKNPDMTGSSSDSLVFEYSVIQKLMPPGIYVIPCLGPLDLKVWQGLMFIRQGWYRGSIFEFEMKFSENYPSEPPEVKFNVPYPVHPRVCSKTGVVNLLDMSKSWSPTSFCSLHIFAYLKCLFYEKENFISHDVEGNLAFQKILSDTDNSFWKDLKQGTIKSIRSIGTKAENGTLIHIKNSPIQLDQNFSKGHQTSSAILEAIHKCSSNKVIVDAADEFIDWFRTTYPIQ